MSFVGLSNPMVSELLSFFISLFGNLRRSKIGHSRRHDELHRLSGCDARMASAFGRSFSLDRLAHLRERPDFSEQLPV